MEEQKTISDAQTKISEKQTDIMEQQNKIALLNARISLYNKLKNLEFCILQIKKYCMLSTPQLGCFDESALSQIDYNENGEVQKLIRLDKGDIDDLTKVFTDSYIKQIYDIDGVFAGSYIGKVSFAFRESLFAQIQSSIKVMYDFAEKRQIADLYRDYNNVLTQLENYNIVNGENSILPNLECSLKVFKGNEKILNQIICQFESQLNLNKEVHPCPTPKPTTKTQS